MPAWLGFTGAVRQLLVLQVDDRPLDQFIDFRKAALRLVEGDQFLTDLGAAWAGFTNAPKREAGEVLLIELQSFTRAMEVAQTTASSEAEKTRWYKRLAGRAGTVAGSVDDLLESLPPAAKAALKLFREAIDLFKSKE